MAWSFVSIDTARSRIGAGTELPCRSDERSCHFRASAIERTAVMVELPRNHPELVDDGRRVAT